MRRSRRSLAGAIGLIAVASAMFLPGRPAAASPSSRQYERLHERAETFIREAAFARAHKLYQRASEMELSPPEARWVEFRLADTGWRAQLATGAPDPAVLDEMCARLQRLCEETAHEPERVRAEAHESLGDAHWSSPQRRDWSAAWPHYQEALRWWAGAREIETARRRYLDMVWRLAMPDGEDSWSWYSGSALPLEILESAARIAVQPADRGIAHLLLASRLRSEGAWRAPGRVEEELRAALEAGRSSPWYDDALFFYAQWLATEGRFVNRPGGVQREQDLPAAVALYRRILAEFRRDQTRYHDDARRQIEEITAPRLGCAVSSVFLPGSEIAFDLSWRNVGAVALSIHRVDLTRDVDPSSSGARQEWIWHVDTESVPTVKEWVVDTQDPGRHLWGHRQVRLQEKLPVGAYLLVAACGGQTARDLILVTDLALVVKSWNDRLLAWVCDASDGKPVQSARVRAWWMDWADGRWTGEDRVARTGEEGLCDLQLPGPGRGRGGHYLVTASVNGREAFAPAQRGPAASDPDGTWMVYATSDRPAYRPGETVHWKVTARVHRPGGHTTPTGQTIAWEITGPRGTIAQGQAALNDFGSAWGDLPLDDSMALGEYRIGFSRAGARLGEAPIFRIEEYTVPEFEVALRMAGDETGRGALRAGSAVKGAVEARYYFGGPVVDAEVELLVSQAPLLRRAAPPHPWPGDEDVARSVWGGAAQVVERRTLRTDAQGRAEFSFRTPPAGGPDLEYRIEARVTDASRRMVAGACAVHVTNQPYSVDARPARFIYRPGETLEMGFRIADSQGRPAAAVGRVTVTQERWAEVWVDPAGGEVTGEELAEARRRHETFPPPAAGQAPAWKLRRRGYVSREIAVRDLRAGPDGIATMELPRAEPGYYRFAWHGEEDGWPAPVAAEGFAWVADATTADLGYHEEGLRIIVDRETFRAGETARVMLAVPEPGRHVLLCVEGDDLYGTQVVHVGGTVRVLDVPIDQRHVPNVRVTALMVERGRLLGDERELHVPPVEKFLSVQVLADRETCEPGQEGTLTVIARDHEGRPVQAEVALGLADEAVYAVQADYAPDPAAFFHSYRQGMRVRTSSSFAARPYAKLDGGTDDADASARGPVEEADERTEIGRLSRAGARQEGAFLRSDDAAAPEAPIPSEAAEGMAPRDAAGGPAVFVRRDFRSTLFWQPDLRTGPDGRATVGVTYADSLSRWRATARAATTDSRFGMATATTRTHKPLIARLQAPRFFVVGDKVTVSGVLSNATDEPMPVVPFLEAQGVEIMGQVRAGRPADAWETAEAVEVPAHGQARVDWIVRVQRAGEATLRLTAAARTRSDAVERTFPVHEHGIEKLVVRSGRVAGERVTVRLDIPAQRKKDSTAVSVWVTPSLAATMLDALPYLVDYPYGCTEQTMSRFLPAAVTARTLRELGIEPAEAMGRIFGGVDREIARRMPDAEKRHDGLALLDDALRRGLERLEDFQHADGGWGWWKEGDGDLYMTAYVLWGLSLAHEAECPVDGGMMDRAASFLEQRIVETETRPDMSAWVLHALASYGRAAPQRAVHPASRQALENLWRNRGRINAATRALAAMSARVMGEEARARAFARGLEDGALRDDAPDESVLLGVGREAEPAVMPTAHWGEAGFSPLWSERPVETTALSLRALLAVDPASPLAAPAMTWLVRNRRGTQWSNTRDTAIAVLALCDYLRAGGELEPRFEYEVFVNDVSIGRREVTAAEALAAPTRHDVPLQFVHDGINAIEIVRRSGQGPIYFAAQARFFSLEEPIAPAGNEIFVQREYNRLIPRPTLLRGVVFDRTALADSDELTSGDRVEVVLTVEAKGDYEYLVLEDLKPAGLEAVAVTSGGAVTARQLSGPPGRAPRYTGLARAVHQELRDRTVALFVDQLDQGFWEIRYELRAEAPGRFHALPVVGHAMYVPEIRANGRELRLTINDRPDEAFAAAEEEEEEDP